MPEQPNINPVLNERWFKWASRWVTYRPILQKIALAGTIMLEAILLVYSGYVWVDYLIVNRNREKLLYQELSQSINYGELHPLMAPKPISVIIVQTMPAGGRGGSYDVIAKLANPNSKWLATVSYQFAVSGENGPLSQTYILNDEEKYIIGDSLATSSGAAAEIIITAVKWQRLREWNKFNERKPNFAVSDVKFTPLTSRKGGEPIVNRVSFNITNESSYNFWSVGLKVIPLKGELAVAARATTIEQVRSQEKRFVSLNIYNVSASFVDSVLVVPEVNVADPDVFMSVEGKPINF